MDLGLGKFANVFKRVGVLKDYSSLVIPAVICIVAVLLFIPTGLLSSNLKGKIEEQSIRTNASRVQSLLTNAVSSEQYKAEKAYQDQFREDANQIDLLSKQTSQRELLSYKIFPEPNDKSMLIFKDFGQNFRSKIDEYFKIINAGDCPTQAEIQLALEKVGGSAKGTGYEKEVIAALVQEKASKISVYAHPYDLPGYILWENYNNADFDSAVMESWYSQLAYWIYEDLFKTIDQMNSESANVLASPVKRLLFVAFPPPSSQQSSTLSIDPALPSYVTSSENSAVSSFTGRYTNDDIDVIHFQLSLILEPQAAMSFIKELCSAKEHKYYGPKGTESEKIFRHNQITVLAQKADVVSKNSKDHEFYNYGNSDVIKLDLICEYVFKCSGYSNIKPGEKKPKVPEKGLKKTKDIKKNN